MAIKRKVGLTEPLSVQVYRGYGVSRRVVVSGRVIEDEDVTPPSRDDSAWDNLVRSYKTFETDEVHGARVRVTLAGETGEATTGREGFFEVAFEGGHYPAGRQEVTAELLSPLDHAGKGNQEQTVFRGEVFVPRPQAEFVVISDVDDTVMHTEATSLVRMVLNTVLTNAYGRVAFPGVGEFYRALARGTSGGKLAGENPNAFFYLTSSMWNVYDVMRLFFDANGVPAGPILMRDLGLTRRHLLKGTHSEHKLARVEELMDLYDDKRFVLIGDTGQHDAEIYGEVARRPAGPRGGGLPARRQRRRAGRGDQEGLGRSAGARRPVRRGRDQPGSRAARGGDRADRGVCGGGDRRRGRPGRVGGGRGLINKLW